MFQTSDQVPVWIVVELLASSLTHDGSQLNEEHEDFEANCWYREQSRAAAVAEKRRQHVVAFLHVFDEVGYLSAMKHGVGLVQVNSDEQNQVRQSFEKCAFWCNPILCQKKKRRREASFFEEAGSLWNVRF